MGWKLDKTEDILTPIMAESAGMVTGVQQIGKGYVQGEEKITLLFRAAIGEKNPRDTIEIKGIPEITSSIAGGINGDVATCAIIVNAIKSIIDASPGLKTMTDISLISSSSL